MDESKERPKSRIIDLSLEFIGQLVRPQSQNKAILQAKLASHAVGAKNAFEPRYMRKKQRNVYILSIYILICTEILCEEAATGLAIKLRERDRKYQRCEQAWEDAWRLPVIGWQKAARRRGWDPRGKCRWPPSLEKAALIGVGKPRGEFRRPRLSGRARLISEWNRSSLRSVEGQRLGQRLAGWMGYRG